MAVVEFVLGEYLRRHLDVLFLTARIREAQVDELDFLILNCLEHIGGCSHAFLLSRPKLYEGI